MDGYFVKIKSRNPYKVYIKSNAISLIPEVINSAGKILVVSENKVLSLYGEKLKTELNKTNAKLYFFNRPEKEDGKSKQVLDNLLTLMHDINLNKNDTCIAFGGGTTSDLTGFACAVFKRGIKYINIPTTVLAMADASIGGKTAINFLNAKNMLGIIYQPSAVLCDTSFLLSLPVKEVSSGFAEIIKCAIIGDKKLAKLLLKTNIDIEQSIYRAVKVKAKFIKIDEFDQNKRMILNLGHTFGHAFESTSSFTVSHGEAVAFGIITACDIASKLNFDCNIKEKAQNMFSNYGLTFNFNPDKTKLIEFLQFDKKSINDSINFVVPTSIGKCKIQNIPLEKLKEVYCGY